LLQDSKYSLKCTIAPKEEPTTEDDPASGTASAATTKTKTEKADIFVYKPELAFKDSAVYYGEIVPTKDLYDQNNYVSTDFIF